MFFHPNCAMQVNHSKLLICLHPRRVQFRFDTEYKERIDIGIYENKKILLV